MTPAVQLTALSLALGFFSVATLVLRLWFAPGKLLPHEVEQDMSPPKGEQKHPLMYGIWEPILVYLLYLISALSINDLFRDNKKAHGIFVDLYVAAWVIAEFVCAFARLGLSLWVLAVWRVICLLVQILSVGLFINPIRKIRGYQPPASNPRIVFLAFLNWTELVALFALLYQALQPGRTWLFNSFTTQVTMNHAFVVKGNPQLAWVERYVVVGQISMSLLLLATLIGMYVSLVGAKQPKEEEAA